MFLKNKITGAIAQFAIAQNDDWKEMTQSEIDAYELEQAKAKKILQCQSYLSGTDWQVIRLSDPTSGEALKEGVAEKRALARSLQINIEACTTLEQLNAINTDF